MQDEADTGEQEDEEEVSVSPTHTYPLVHSPLHSHNNIKKGTNKIQGPRPAPPPDAQPSSSSRPPSAAASSGSGHSRTQSQSGPSSPPSSTGEEAAEAERKVRATRMAEDAVTFAKRGSKITKYIFHGGAPHQRFMTISDDRLRLRVTLLAFCPIRPFFCLFFFFSFLLSQWGFNERKLTASLDISSIYTVLPGVQTPAFKNTAGFVDSPTSSLLSFFLPPTLLPHSLFSS